MNFFCECNWLVIQYLIKRAIWSLHTWRPFAHRHTPETHTTITHTHKIARKLRKTAGYINPRVLRNFSGPPQQGCAIFCCAKPKSFDYRPTSHTGAAEIIWMIEILRNYLLRILRKTTPNTTHKIILSQIHHFIT